MFRSLEPLQNKGCNSAATDGVLSFFSVTPCLLYILPEILECWFLQYNDRSICGFQDLEFSTQLCLTRHAHWVCPFYGKSLLLASASCWLLVYTWLYLNVNCVRIVSQNCMMRTMTAVPYNCVWKAMVSCRCSPKSGCPWRSFCLEVLGDSL